MRLRHWLDDLFLYAPSGASADATEEDFDDIPEGATTEPKNGKAAKVDAKSDEEVEDEDPEDDEEEDDEDELVDEVDETPPAKTLKDFNLPEDPEVLARTFAQLQQQAAQAQQMQAMYWQQQNLLAQQQAAQQKPAEEPQKPKLPWEIPEFDPRAKQFLMVGEDGNVVVKPGGDPTLPQRYQEWLNARDEAMNKFLQNPYEALQDGFKPIIEERAKAIVQEVMQQQQAQQFEAQQQAELTAYDQQYHDLYFDAAGQLNQLGQVWNHYYTQARQHGLPQPTQHAHRLAMAWEAEQHVASAPAPKSVAEQDAERKHALLKRGARKTTNRGGAQGKAGRSVAATNGGDPWNRLKDKFNAMPDEAFEL